MPDVERDRDRGTAVTVVVPTYNRSGYLAGLVEALKAQTHRDFKVVIVDDGSTDSTAESASTAIGGDPRFRVVSVQHGGPAAARNAACSKADTPWLAFTDDDCFPQPMWLEVLLAEAERTGAEIVQGATTTEPSVRRAEQPWFARGMEVHRLSGRYQTCNLLVRTDRLLAVGGFDDGFPFFGEDIDLGVRIVRSGATAVFTPDAVVHHRIRPRTYLQYLRHRWRYAQLVRLVAVNPDARGVFPHRYVAQRTHVALWVMLPVTASAARRGRWIVPAAAVATYVVHRSFATRAEGRPLHVRAGRAPLELVGVAVEAVGFAVQSIRHRSLLI